MLLDARKYLADIAAKLFGLDLYTSEHGDFTVTAVAGQKYVNLSNFPDTLKMESVVTAYRVDAVGSRRSISLSQVQVNDTLKRITFPTELNAFATGEVVVIGIRGKVRAYESSVDATVQISQFLRKILKGEAFSFMVTDTIAAITPKLLLVRTSATAKMYLKALLESDSTSGVTIDIYSAPTVTTTGDAVDTPNMNFGAEATPEAEVYEDCTVSADGDLVHSYHLPAGKQGVVTVHPDAAFVLAADTDYLIRLTADAATPVVSLFGEFYEIVVPELIVLDAPVVDGDAATNDSTPTWTWGEVTGATRYRVSFDESDWTEVDALEYTPATGLNDGEYTIYVQAGDAIGNWSDSGTFVTVIQQVAPDAPEISGDEKTADNTPTFTWTEPEGAISYRWRLDGGSWTAVTPATVTLPTTDDGEYLLEVQARDTFGNWSASGEFSFEIDTVAPGVPVVEGDELTRDNTPTFTWEAVTGASKYRWSLNEADWTETEDLEVTLSTQGEGEHTIYVQAGDDVDNWSASGHLTFTVDTIAPDAVVISGDALTSDTTPTWTWTKPAGAVLFRYRFGELEGWVETEDQEYTAPQPLDEGSHTIEVQCSDLAGNWSVSDSFETVIDSQATTAPVVSGATPTGDTTPTWTWTTPSGAVLFRYKLDEDPHWHETVETSYTAPDPLDDGLHTLMVEAADAAGNWSASGSHGIFVDAAIATAPEVSGTTPTDDRTPTWEWTTPAGAIGFRYALASKAELIAILTGEAASTCSIDDEVSVADGEVFKALEEVSVPAGNVSVVADPDTETFAAAAHGFADGTKGQFTANEVAALKATGIVLVTGSGTAVIEVNDSFFVGSAVGAEFLATEEVTIPDGTLSVTAVPETDKFTAVAHGYANGTKGQFTANIIEAAKATGVAILTGGAGAVCEIDDEVSVDGGPVFKATEEVTVPSGTLNVTPDSDTEKFGAVAHGYANGTKGQFTADYVNKATVECVLTGDAAAEVDIDDEVSVAGDTPIVFKATENKVVPSGALSVVAVPATDDFVAVAHGYTNGTKGQFTGVALPSGIAANEDYYIVNATVDGFQVSLTEGGAPDLFSTAGDTVVFTPSVRKIAVAFEAELAGSEGNVDAEAIDTLDATLQGEGFTVVTNPLAATGGDDEMALPSGIAADTDYYIVNAAADDFQVSLEDGGDPDTFTTNGTNVVFNPSVRKIAVAIEAAVAGDAGNVDASDIDTLSGDLTTAGFTEVTNTAATTGGADAEEELPDGILPLTDYYIVSRAANDFKVSLSDGGDPVEFSTAGNTVVFEPSVRKVTVAVEAKVAGAAGNVGIGAINFTEVPDVSACRNEAVTTGGADAYQEVPEGIEVGVDYYMVNAAENSFQVATSPDGTPVEFSTAGNTVVFEPSVRKIAVLCMAAVAGDDGNVEANTVNTLSAALESAGFTAVTNKAAQYGFGPSDWTETPSASYTPASNLDVTAHTLSVQAKTALENWTVSGEHEIVIIEGT